MSWYRTGTISLTNGSKNVTGTGTLFVSNVKSGFALLAPDFSVYEVDNVSSDTTFTLKENYRGTTVSNGAYGIFQTQGIIKDLTDEVTALINTFGAFRDAYNNGDLVGKGLEFKGILNSPSELPASPAVSDAYLIGTYIYVYTGTVGGWKNSNIAGIIPRGAWNASTTYAVNDTVTYSGSQYRRKVAGTTSTDPATDTTNWDLFVSIGQIGPAGVTPRGAWNSATAYVVNDTVQYNGSQYRRIIAGTTSGDPATDTTNWELFVSRGVDGAGSVSKVNNISPDINGNVTLTSDNISEGSTNQWFTAARVRSTVLTGLSTATNAIISATDSVLSALGKLQKQISDLSSSVASSLGLKADLASPAFTGTPTAPTATYGTNTDQIATTAFVQAAATIDLFPVSASVSTNQLTVSLEPSKYNFRSSSLTSGAVTSINLSNTVSLVIPNTATLGTTSNVASRLVILAINNAGTIEPAIVNLGGGVVLDESSLINTTSVAAGSNSAGVVYSATARTNVPFRVAGYLDITEATAGTWASAPSLVQPVGGNAMTALSSIGYSQSWQAFTPGSTRVSGTVYYNTTGRPIQVSVLVNNTNGSGFSSNSTTLANPVAGSFIWLYSYIIPPNSSYSCSTNGSAIYNWSELR